MSIDWGADPSAVGGAGWPAPNPALDALAAAVDAVQGSDPSERDAWTLAQEVEVLQSLSARLTARQVTCVATMDTRGDAAVLGYRSVQSWLRAAVRLAPGAAKGIVALARRVEGCPATGESFTAGRIHLPHAQQLTRTISEITPCFDDPADATTMEADLVDVAERVDPLRLSNACRRLRIQALPQRASADDWDALQQRTLSIAQTFGGLGVINGTLDPLGTETVMTAIHAFAGPAGEYDTRTPGQRRADALTEICRRVLTHGDAPVNGGERPQVSVIVPLATIEQRVGAQPGELAWTGPVSPELVRQMLCDAAVTRIVVDGTSQPLDVGRATRAVPAGMRRAVMIRDRHCQWPDCDVPAVWCDCHHIQHWAGGGHTTITNLIMLCGYHHTRLHATGMTILRRPDGRTEIIPDEHSQHGPTTDRGP